MGESGRRRNLRRGVRYLRRAVEARVPRAMYVMAILMARGDGVRKDSAAALTLCRDAALAGELWAQWMLALMYERGDGCAPDPPESRRWLELAAENGHEKAQRKLELIES